MIDTRFPPRSSSTEVPLYPSREMHVTDVPGDSEQRLGAELCRERVVGSGGTVVGSSASALLCNYLQQSHQGTVDKRIGVPSYICQSVVDAVVNSNSVPVFYDVEPDISLGDRAIDYMIEQECSSCVWPSFFGTAPRDSRLVDRLHDASISIIFDEAQSDPFSHETEKFLREGMYGDDVAVYSFGASKYIAGLGGGALYMCRANDRLRAMQAVIDQENLSIADMRAQEERAHLARICRTIPDFAIRRGYAAEPFAQMDNLLESIVPSPQRDLRIGTYEAAFALRQIASYRQASAHHAEHYSYLRDAVSKEIGEEALSFMSKVEKTPSIFALKIDPEKRYDLMSAFSQEGVQTTWYYYPMNRISRYAGFPSQGDTNTEIVSGSVLVLPFQWTHTDREVELVMQAMGKIKKII